MDWRNTTARFQQLGTEMANRAHTGGAVAPGVTRFLCRCKESFGIGIFGNPGLFDRSGQHQRRNANQSQRSQVFEGVIRRGRVEDFGNRHIAIDHQTNRMVVVGPGHFGGANITASPHFVFHNDWLAQ